MRYRRWLTPRLGAAFLAVLLLLGFLALEKAILAGKTQATDTAILDAFSGCERSPITRFAAVVETFTLDWPVVLVIIIPVVVSLALRGHFREAALAGAMPAVAILLSEVVKHLVERPRPPGQLLYAIGSSFPSDHATVGAAFYGALAYLVWTHVRHRPVRFVGTAALILLPISIGFSRVCLRAHYPSDVFGGWLLGLCLLSGSLALLEGRGGPPHPPQRE